MGFIDNTIMILKAMFLHLFAIPLSSVQKNVIALLTH